VVVVGPDPNGRTPRSGCHLGVRAPASAHPYQPDPRGLRAAATLEPPGRPVMPETRVTVPSIADAPARGERIVMVTAYDCPQGRQADAAGVDVVLVGDSLAMVVLGHEDTLAVTMEEMLHH